MKEQHYAVKKTVDGKLKFMVFNIKEEIISERQATKKEIKIILKDIRDKRELYDKTLLELIK